MKRLCCDSGWKEVSTRKTINVQDTPCESSQANRKRAITQFNIDTTTNISGLVRSEHVHTSQGKGTYRNDKIEGNVNTCSFLFSLHFFAFHSFFFFLPVSFCSRTMRRNDSHEIKRESTTRAKRRRIRHVDMWESTSRRRTIGVTLIAILHGNLIMPVFVCVLANR